MLTHFFIVGGNLLGVPTLFGWLHDQFWLLYGFQLRSIATLLILQLILVNSVRSMQTKLTQSSIDIEIAKTIAQKDSAEREQQRHFLSMLTHELKTPLSVIRMRLGAATPTQRMQAHAKQAVQDIDAIVERCAMVSQIEDSSRTQHCQSCQIDEIIHNILIQQQVTDRVEVQFAEGALEIIVKSDPLLLRTILSNLIDNAIKYTPPQKAVKIAVLLGSENGIECICIRVENTPAKAGVPDAARVFEKYYRASGAHQQSGSGLGLYIAKALAQKLGGTLHYRLQAQRVIFELCLPI